MATWRGQIGFTSGEEVPLEPKGKETGTIEQTGTVALEQTGMVAIEQTGTALS